MNIVNIVYKHIIISFANMLPRSKFFNRKRSLFYRFAGMNIAENVVIGGAMSFRIDTLENICIGLNTYLNSEVRFGCQNDKIIIGSDCLVGPRVCFESASHKVKHDPVDGRGFFTKEIIIEDQVWIGAGAIILQGVTIGKGSVVAAGAVVTKSVSPLTVVGGIPAKVLKNI